MNWFYAANDERKGPVSQTELDALVKQGTITANTLVWCEGMATWQPHGTFATPSPAPPVIEANPNAMICADCRQMFTPDELVQIGGQSVCAKCKPLALQRLREGLVITGSDAEQIRKLHLNHEASIKSVGTLYLLGGILVMVASIGLLIAAWLQPGSTPMAISIAPVLIMLPLAALQIWTSFGLRKLKPAARIAAGILSGLGLLSFPIGTLINGYILYLLLSTKSKMVFSDEYKNVIAATPHIKYRTSILVWILLGIVVFLILFGLGAVLVSSLRRG